MTQYNSLNVKLSNSKINKLKARIKNDPEVTLNLSSNLVGDSNGETNFPYKLLLIHNSQGFVKFLLNLSSANINFLKLI